MAIENVFQVTQLKVKQSKQCSLSMQHQAILLSPPPRLTALPRLILEHVGQEFSFLDVSGMDCFRIIQHR